MYDLDNKIKFKQMELDSDDSDCFSMEETKNSDPEADIYAFLSAKNVCQVEVSNYLSDLRGFLSH